MRVVAEQAKKWARDFIREGTTQLQANEYSIEKQAAIATGVRSLRALGPSELSVRDYLVNRFEQTNDLSKKFSLGNCNEMAFLALDYVVHATKHIRAEVYTIRGGDHVFLVIGRAKGSVSSKPKTWGEDCLICDPWADQVYAAIRYRDNLHNFFSDENKRSCVELFDPERHTLNPLQPYNADHIRHVLNHKCQEIYQGYWDRGRSLLKTYQVIDRFLVNNGLGDSDFCQSLCRLSAWMNQSKEDVLQEHRLNYRGLRQHLETMFASLSTELTRYCASALASYLQQHQSSVEPLLLFQEKKCQALLSRLLAYVKDSNNQCREASGPSLQDVLSVSLFKQAYKAQCRTRFLGAFFGLGSRMRHRVFSGKALSVQEIQKYAEKNPDSTTAKICQKLQLG